MNSIKGKFALITGGTQGLGVAIARRLAENGAAGIITIGRSEEKGKEVAKKITEDTGCKTLFVKTDLPEVDQCRNAVSFAKKEFGKIDILVNAAGITDRGNIVDTSEELFDKMIGVNLKGPYFLAPCVTSPHQETDRLEAKQLRVCLLSKRELGF